MLVLSRKLGETVCIGSEITLSVVEVKGNRVKIGIEAPGIWGSGGASLAWSPARIPRQHFESRRSAISAAVFAS